MKYDDDDLAHLQRLATLGTLAAGTAHEVNNVVTHLLASMHRLGTAMKDLRERNGGNEDVLVILEEALDTSLACCDRLRSVARSVTTSARTSGEDAHPVVLADVIAEAVALVSPAMEATARLEVACATDLPFVRVNSGKLVQVFVNLLVNAMHAIRERDYDDHVIEISARRDGDAIVVDVKDTGTGIAAEDMPRIFDPFFTTKPTDLGTGLGLAVSRDIVRACGGSLAATSEPGAGTTITLRLTAL